MNHLETNFNGGVPIHLNDLRFQEDAVRAAIKGAMSAFGIDTFANSFIISGCVVTGPTCSEGWICLKGEILRVEAHTVPTPPLGQILVWSIETAYDPAGSKTLQSGGIIEMHHVKRGKIIAAVPSGDYLVAQPTSGRLIDKLNALRTKLFAYDTWHAVGGVGEPAFQSGFANYVLGGGPLMFTLSETGAVTIRGRVTSSNAMSGSNVIFNLPTGYRPTAEIIKLVIVYDNSNSDIGWLTVYSNGNVALNNVLNGTAFSGSYIVDMEFDLRTT